MLVLGIREQETTTDGNVPKAVWQLRGPIRCLAKSSTPEPLQPSLLLPSRRTAGTDGDARWLVPPAPSDLLLKRGLFCGVGAASIRRRIRETKQLVPGRRRRGHAPDRRQRSESGTDSGTAPILDFIWEPRSRHANGSKLTFPIFIPSRRASAATTSSPSAISPFTNSSNVAANWASGD